MIIGYSLSVMTVLAQRPLGSMKQWGLKQEGHQLAFGAKDTGQFSSCRHRTSDHSTWGCFALFWYLSLKCVFWFGYNTHQSGIFLYCHKTKLGLCLKQQIYIRHQYICCDIVDMWKKSPVTKDRCPCVTGRASCITTQLDLTRLPASVSPASQ